MEQENDDKIKAGFCITGYKGFRIRFANGWSVSVQWGPGNYASPRDYAEPYDAPHKAAYYSKQTAEVAIFTPDEQFHKGDPGWGDDVLGYVTPDEVLKWLDYAAKQPAQVKP